MSYVSLLKNIPEILSQPTGIAAIASIGIHGAIALIVPLMPVESNKPKETASSKSVGILELSQADQNRLPQTPGTPQIAVAQQLPQFPLQQQLGAQPPVPLPNFNGQTAVLPPLPPSAYTQPVLPPLPTAPNNYGVPSLPTRPSLRIPRQDFKFDDSGFKASRQKFTPPPVTNFDESRVVTPPVSSPLAVDRLPELPPGNLPPEIENAPIPNSVPSPNTAIANGRVTPQFTEPESNETATQNQNSENIIAQNPKNGELIEQTKSYEELRKLLQRQYPNAEEKPVIRDTIAVNQAGMEGTALGFVVVDPDKQDKKVLEIKFQNKSSLPPALELKARQYFKAKSLKGDKKISLYPFRLDFKDMSKAAETTSEPKPTPAVTTRPSSQPIINRLGNGTQLKPTPSATVEPSSRPGANQVQSRPTPLETTKPSKTAEPSPTSAANQDQPTPTPSETTEPSATKKTNSNQLPTSQETDRQLIQKLLEVREQRENSKSKK